MDRDHIMSLLERVFVERWDYSGGESNYFERKREDVLFVAGRMGRLLSRPVHVNEPANLQNFYNVEICLTAKQGGPRHTSAYPIVEEYGEACYLELLFSVILPVTAANWYRYTKANIGLELQTFDGLDPAWLAKYPESEDVIYKVMGILDEVGISLLDEATLCMAAKPSWPVPFPHNENPTFRDFIFPGLTG